MIRLLTLLLLAPVASGAWAQDAESIQKRCETILVNAINAGEQPTLQTIGLCKHLPIDRVVDHLKLALKSNDILVRLTAAEFCVQHAPEVLREATVKSMNDILSRHEKERIFLRAFNREEKEGETEASRKAIVKAMAKSLASNEMRAPSKENLVQRNGILMKLGDVKAKETIKAWVNHDLSLIKKKEWICPMMCVRPSPKKGRCNVCAMELVNVQPELTEADWFAKLAAIQAYQQMGNRVTASARSIVISKASPHIRLLAANIWAKEHPADARPHIAIFLHGVQREFALTLLSASMPDRFVKELEAVVHSSKASMSLRLCAYDGLLKSGKAEYLTELREMIDADEKSGQEASDKGLAILLMTTHAEAQDVGRLKRLLNSEYQVWVAEALLALVKKGKKNK